MKTLKELEADIARLKATLGEVQELSGTTAVEVLHEAAWLLTKALEVAGPGYDAWVDRLTVSRIGDPIEQTIRTVQIIKTWEPT